MQQIGQTVKSETAGQETADAVKTGLLTTVSASANITDAERKRVETVVETLAGLHSKGENLSEVLHDARNMVTALGLYCDLLEEPGVLTASFIHYAGELRLVATASRRLVEKMMTINTHPAAKKSCEESGLCAMHPGAAGMLRACSKDPLPGAPIDDMASELLASRNLLAALAGPAIVLTVEAEGSALPVQMSSEDLTRILVNLVKNAVEAMHDGGHIMMNLHEFHTEAGTASWLVLTVEDTGPGIPGKALEKIFVSGYTTGSSRSHGSAGWTASHHGLGLSITRSIVESAGGRIQAANRAAGGACFTIEMPVRTH